MATSKYQKRTMAIRQIATGTQVGGKQLRLQLNRDQLISEHRVNVSVSQAYTGVPTSVDPRDFITDIAVETSDGRRVFLTGPQVYDFGRFTEPASAVLSTLAATSTASWAFDIHYANDEALLDLLTALRSAELSTLDLVIDFAADAANGFKGGTVPLVATYNVAVESQDYEMLNETQFGLKLGAFKHFQESQQQAAATKGAQPDFSLSTGNTTRFISFHTYDTTGAVPVLADGIIGNVKLNIAGRDFRVTTFAAMRQDNVTSRGFDHVGVGVIDFGDDENGWLNLEAVAQAKISWDVLTSAPAGWRVVLGQDYTKTK